MLKHLSLKNYALFRETQVDFPAGLTILTGETGAGKSLLVGALGLIMGKRADSAVFMHEEKCVIEATFGDLSQRIVTDLEALEDIDMDGEEVLIRREIRPNGKSRAFVNDSPVSLQVLRQVSALLLDLHGQHENQVLLSQERQIDLLDAYADAEELVEAFAEQLRQSAHTRKEIHELRQQEQDAQSQLEYYQFQVQELETADIKAGEEEELEAELNLLQHATEISDALGGAVNQLYDDDAGIYSQLSQLLEPLRKIQELNKQVDEEVKRLVDIQETLKEAAFSFQSMLDTVENDPERLAFIEERLAVYHRLKLKYKAADGAALVQLYEELQGKLQAVDSLSDRIAALEKTYSSQQAGLRAKGLALESARQQAKPILEEKIGGLLAQVGFHKSRFEIAIERLTHAEGDLDIEGESIRPTPKGLNRVYFLIQTNPGLPIGPLAQIASGGEISRVMLAIKAALAEKSEFPVLIFDEIDTGISGEIANKVGVVMQQLARSFQILSITHLPQIAAKGHQHYQIRKQVRGESTSSTVEPLSLEERVHIIAQMLSGEEPTDSAMRNAQELMG